MGVTTTKPREPMPTRNRIVTAVLATAAIAATAPAAAEAHHVAGGSAQCALVDNVPTITASADFVGFQEYNKPIDGQLRIDGAVVEAIDDFRFAGLNGTWKSAPHAVEAGGHHVSGALWWPHQDGRNGRFEADVVCPAPEVTPPPKTPAPTPTPAQHPTPPPAAPPASAGAVLGATASGPCVPAALGRYRVTVTPKHQLHGLVTFHLRGARTSHIRWYVDTRRAGRSGKRWEFIRRHGRAYGIYLWAQQRWGKHLWGRHTVEARFRVTDSCGMARAVRVQRLYFNHDPLPDDPIFAHPGR
jgi:hypothetical protein